MNNIDNGHLHTIFPDASVRLITIKPMHCTKSMSPVFVPHPFICIARRIAASAKSLSNIVDPISVIVWQTISIVLQMSLKRMVELLHFEQQWMLAILLSCQFPTWWSPEFVLFRPQQLLVVTSCVAKPSVIPPERSLASANQAVGICINYMRHLANMIR